MIEIFFANLGFIFCPVLFVANTLSKCFVLSVNFKDMILISCNYAKVVCFGVFSALQMKKIKSSLFLLYYVKSCNELAGLMFAKLCL